MLTSTPITTATETTTTVSVSISTIEKEIPKPIVDDLGTLVTGPAQPILNVS